MFRGLLVLLAIVTITYGNALLPTIPSPEARTVGGENAKIEDFPYQVLVKLNGNTFCGGSILNPRAVISAAHCFPCSTLDIFTVEYGSTEIYKGITLDIERIIIHENYNTKTFDYDIAIVHLAKEIVFGPNAQPIALANNTPAPGTKVVATGWGLLYYRGPSPNILQKVELKMMAHDACVKEYELGRIPVTDRMICAGVRGKTSCSGDSGGPLVANNELVGIVSWGNSACDHPAVYTSVASLRSWIDSKIESKNKEVNDNYLKI